MSSTGNGISTTFRIVDLMSAPLKGIAQQATSVNKELENLKSAPGLEGVSSQAKEAQDSLEALNQSAKDTNDTMSQAPDTPDIDPPEPVPESTGDSWVSLATKAAKAVAACGAVKAAVSGLKMAVTEGANLQQSIGGVETLYKKSAGTVIANANKAWKTAGISANDYMEQSTTFAAALLQSLGGDTNKAAQMSDMAIKDMSDNANKFGSNIEDIQNAYQGFSKQNYTMLDNLKLGGHCLAEYKPCENGETLMQAA